MLEILQQKIRLYFEFSSAQYLNSQKPLKPYNVENEISSILNWKQNDFSSFFLWVRKWKLNIHET